VAVYDIMAIFWGAQTIGLIVGGRVDKGNTICYIGLHALASFTAQHSRHIIYINYFLETFPRAMPTWAETIMLVYTIPTIDSKDACAVKDNLEKFAKNCTKTLVQWNQNTFLKCKTRIYPKWFPNASAVTWSLVLQTRNLANNNGRILNVWWF
jgi:hypothetical protein